MLKDMRDLMKHVWKTMTLQKESFYREVSPMARVYDQLEMVIFCFGITVGRTFFIRIPKNILRHGDILMLLWFLQGPMLITTANCFAEMAALVPAVGAHYHYCYSTICEIVGFLVGWNLILAYSAITIAKCSSLSRFIDRNLLGGWVEMNLRFTDERGVYFLCFNGFVDIIFPLLTVTMACQAAWAVRGTKVVFNILTAITVIVIIILIITFGIRMSFEKVEIEGTEDSKKLYDIFLTAQSALIGYESLGVLGEEAKNPTQTIPHCLTTSVKLLLVTYIVFTFTLSFGVTENEAVDIDDYNPIGTILNNMGLTGLANISILGSLSALWCSTYGSMFIVVRILYAMSRDGLIFRVFSKVDRYTKTPAIPATIFGFVVGLIGTFVTVEYGISFFSLILGKIMTSVCLLITRYRLERGKRGSIALPDEQDRWVLLNVPNPKKQPTIVTHRISMLLIYNAIVSAMACVYCVIIIYSTKYEDHYKDDFEILGYISIVCFIAFISLLRRQPTNNRDNLSYQTGGVPATPVVAIVFDFLSAIILCRETLFWGFVWCGLGIIFYFSYSIRHSQESRHLFRDGTRWNPLEMYHDFNVDYDSVSSIRKSIQLQAFDEQNVATTSAGKIPVRRNK